MICGRSGRFVRPDQRRGRKALEPASGMGFQTGRSREPPRRNGRACARAPRPRVAPWQPQRGPAVLERERAVAERFIRGERGADAHAYKQSREPLGHGDFSCPFLPSLLPPRITRSPIRHQPPWQEPLRSVSPSRRRSSSPSPCRPSPPRRPPRRRPQATVSLSSGNSSSSDYSRVPLLFVLRSVLASATFCPQQPAGSSLERFPRSVLQARRLTRASPTS